MRNYREKNISVMLNFFRIATLIGVIGGIIEGYIPIWFLLSLPAIYFLPEILFLLWWVVTLPFILLLMLFGVSLYSPLFLVSWISDKFHSSGHSMKSLVSSCINFIKRHCTLIKVTALTLLIIGSFVGYGLAEKTGNLWFLLPFAIFLVYALLFIINEKLS